MRAWLLLLLAFPATAAAQELGVTAEVERPWASTGGEDPTVSATDVDARDRPTELDTLESALREVPGARPLSSGAYGSASTLALRGSDADQVDVLFGEIPLATADGGAFDLSSVPLWLLDRVEVYRSGAPTWLGAGGIGGLVRLVPRDALGPPRFGLTLGAGSFGLVHARLSAQAENEDLAWTSAAGVTSSEGDFPYVDDRRTLFTPEDDVERRRENGWVREGAGLGHLRLRVAGGRLDAILFGIERLAGVPGPASQPTRAVQRNETNVLAALGFELARDDWRLAITTSGAHRLRRFTDLFGEVGLLPSATDDRQWRTLVRFAAEGLATPWLGLTGVALWSHEELLPYDALARQPNGDSARDAGTFALEARLFGRVDDVRLELRPSARLALVGSRLIEIRPERAGETNDTLALAPTGRIGAAVEPIRGLSVAASFATATRTPSMIELFGDRGYLRGDTALRPERAETIDLGVALRGRYDIVRGRAELRGFVTFASDLIRYRRTSQYTAVPENVASAMLFGGELGVNGQITRHFELIGALTLLETRTEYLDAVRRLPLRPPITAYARPTVHVFELGPLARIDGWSELTYVAESYVHPANDPGGLLPARMRIAAGISAFAWENRLRIDVVVHDVLDQRGTDLLGFPLPGRSLQIALHITNR